MWKSCKQLRAREWYEAAAHLSCYHHNELMLKNHKIFCWKCCSVTFGSQAGVRILFALVGYQFRYSLIDRRASVHCTALLFDTYTDTLLIDIYIYLRHTFHWQRCCITFIWHFVALFIASVVVHLLRVDAVHTDKATCIRIPTKTNSAFPAASRFFICLLWHIFSTQWPQEDVKKNGCNVKLTTYHYRQKEHCGAETVTSNPNEK